MIENGIEIRIETSMEMNENDKPDGILPMFDYSTADQVDQMQQEANANDRFSQNVYIIIFSWSRRNKFGMTLTRSQQMVIVIT